MAPPHRGIVLTAAEVQVEGLNAVLDRIAATGATAIGPTLGVFAPAEPGQGRREPPLDVAGAARLLDRPLWGQRELVLQGYASRPVDPALWADVSYPPPPLAPPELRVDVVQQIIDGGHARGLSVHLQLSPYTLPGAPGGQSAESGHAQGPVGDRPLRIDGSVAERVVAGHGCLNNPRVRALGLARLRQAAQDYPTIDGLSLDWAEYTCYFLEDAFTCVCAHCRQAALAQGYDWERIERDTRALWEWLHHLTAADLTALAGPEGWPAALVGGLLARPGVADLLRFKAATVAGVVAELRAALDAAGGGAVALEAHAFPPPWNLLTGADYGRLGRIAQVLRTKLFTFHWPMIVHWWSESLLAWNPGLSEVAVLRAVLAGLDLPLPPDEHRTGLADWGMPRPDEPHPITVAGLTRKLDQAVAQADGAPVLAYLHSYRPAAEFRAVLAAAAASTVAGCWVQRYGYLSDEKLAVLRAAWTGADR